MWGGGSKNPIFEIVGLAEWYVPAIIAYHAIHNNVEIINNVSEINMRFYLASKPLSMNSKNLVKQTYWDRVSGKKLKIFYSYVKFSSKAGNVFDIHQLTKHKFSNIDLLTYSFPCQDLSIQGNGKGIENGTRSGLLYEIKRYIASLEENELPKYLLMENVKALFNKNHKEDFNKWIKFLQSKGYQTDFAILNSQNFGSAQKRERAFALSSRVGAKKLPLANNKKAKVLKDILNKDFNETYRLKKLEKYKRSSWRQNKKSNEIQLYKIKNYTSFSSETYVYNKKHVGCTLTASGANSRIKISESDKKIRVMNPKEAYRYMGFTTKDFNKINKHKILTPAQIIFTAGNSISVEVLEEIFKVVI